MRNLIVRILLLAATIYENVTHPHTWTAGFMAGLLLYDFMVGAVRFYMRGPKVTIYSAGSPPESYSAADIKRKEEGL